MWLRMRGVPRIFPIAKQQRKCSNRFPPLDKTKPSVRNRKPRCPYNGLGNRCPEYRSAAVWKTTAGKFLPRSEEHTSELQSQSNLVCRLLLEKRQSINNISATFTCTAALIDH